MGGEHSPESTGNPPSRPFFHKKNPWLWGILAGLVIVPMLRFVMPHKRVPKPPPVIGQIPDFELTNQFGKRFGSKDLRGKVYVANFFFTSCQTVCLRLSRAMSHLQKRFSRAKVPIKLVSISVDPENDTPAELKRHAEDYSADFSRWTFLTGKRADIERLVEKGFLVAMGRKTMTGSIVDIAHSEKFAIVDQKGRLRGLYSSDDKGLDEIYHRAQHVLRPE